MSIIDYLYDQGGSGAEFMLTGENMPKGWGDNDYYTDKELEEQERKSRKLSELRRIDDFLKSKQHDKYDIDEIYTEGILDTEEGWAKRKRLVKLNQSPSLKLEGIDFFDLSQTFGLEDINNVYTQLNSFHRKTILKILAIEKDKEDIAYRKKMLKEIRRAIKKEKETGIPR